MNKNQIETKKLFWKMVEAIENTSDTTTKDVNGRTLERGITLDQGAIMFSLEDGLIRFYPAYLKMATWAICEDSTELLMLKELFEDTGIMKEVE